jgi:predicted Ser/Thr protein kinase
MGVVYRARQKTLDRVVALKLLAPERVSDPAFAERFAREAQALAKLNHPNIVTIHDFGEAGGFFYLLMEFVDGVNLRQAMKAGRFTPEQALAIVPPICEALQYAHEHGIVHRDIKPENLLLDRAGRVMIADFGIAKMLGEEAVTGLAESQPAGTPQYMAPEQKDHRRTDHRADIYSLGVVLYELLTGELPADKLEPPSCKVQIDVRLDEIVLRALEKAPELRYQTAGEFRTQVETIGRVSAVPSVESGAVTPAVAGGNDGPSRFSRTAIVGAILVGLGMFLTPFLVWMSVQILTDSHWNPAVGEAVLTIAYSLLWLVCLFGGTILGGVAVSQIRRSEGKLRGLGLAVFDGLLFPLLGLTGLSAWLWAWVFRFLLYPHQIDALRIGSPAVTVSKLESFVYLHWVALIVVCTFLTAGALGPWIVRRVWRGVSPRSSRDTGGSPFAHLAMSFASMGGILGVAAWAQMPQPSQVLVWSVLAAALLGLVLSIPVRKTPLGKTAMIVAFLNISIWLLVACVGLFVHYSSISVRADFEPDVDRQASEKGQMQGRLLGLDLELATARKTLRPAHSRRHALEGELAALEQKQPGLRDAAYWDLAKQKRGQLTTERDRLGATYREAHPKVVAVQQQLDALAELLAGEQSPLPAR